jgi:phage-related baseplate assembly protein
LTTTLIGCTASNTDPVVGNDRESATAYRERCRKSSARLSLGGPSAIYEYLANTNLDGTPLYNAAAVPAPVGITRTQVSSDSATGIVTAYYATASGAPIADDVTAANLNIEQYSSAVPDAHTFVGTGALELNVVVSGSVRIKNFAGLDAPTIRSAIVASLAELFETIPIGGFDSSGGTGTLYLNDVEAAVKTAYPGLYGVTMTSPIGPIYVSDGYVLTLNSPVGNWTITVVN